MSCGPCAAAKARRLAQQQTQSTGTSGSWLLIMPNGAKEAFPTELAAREANRLKGNKGLVRKA
jgi:hypothetical protein